MEDRMKSKEFTGDQQNGMAGLVGTAENFLSLWGNCLKNNDSINQPWRGIINAMANDFNMALKMYRGE